jgi:hypothetical protein
MMPDRQDLEIASGMNAASLPMPAGQRRLVALLLLITAAFAVAGLAAMFVLSPKVLYADPWRFMAHFLTTPWPWNVLEADNGHRELFPNLVRVLELEWLHANQWLQITVGAALACATAAVLAWGIHREPAGAAAKATVLFFAVAGIFWLGNERSLAHGNESVHVYLVTLCLTLGCWLLSDRSADASPKRLAIVAVLGIVATFSFGSGIACFAGYVMVLLLRRAPWSSVGAVVAGAIVAVALHFSLGNTGLGNAGGGPSLQLVPQLSRWLSAPFVYAAWPLLDSSAAAQIPIASARDAALLLAQGFESLFGQVRTATWPNALLAVGGIGWLLLSSRATWRQPTARRMQRVALAMAWFALTVGVLVCVSRAGYFVQYPQQVVAPRYVPWSSLFWSGLAMATVLHWRPSKPSYCTVSALLVAVLLAPSQAWMAMLAYRTQSLAELNAVGAAVGVIDENAELGENIPSEIATALPLVRRSGTAMFAWPETRAMGEPLPADAQAVVVENLRQGPVANRLGSPGYTVVFELEASECPRLVMVGEAGKVVGMAVRIGSGPRWQGWAQQQTGPEPEVFALCGSKMTASPREGG